MKESSIKAKVIENKEISDKIFIIKLKGKFNGEPGQFFMLRAWKGLDPFLSRPLSIFDLGEDYISFLYEDRGRGTNLLSRLKEGDEMSLLGPLGNSFLDLDFPREGIALVGGGIGIAPLYYLAKRHPEKFDFYAGFKDEAYLVDELEKICKSVHISTDTGSQGHKGFITEIIDYKNYEQIITCGPIVMMEKIIKEKENTIISMEERMACGIGACMGCTIETLGGNKRVCKDGPVFHGKEVVFNA